MRFDEVKQLSRKSWEEKYTYLLCIDRSKKKNQRSFCVCNDGRKTYIECIPEIEPFKFKEFCNTKVDF